MIATLRLEAIGDNYRRVAKAPFRSALRQVQRSPREHARRILSPGARPWVAHITGTDPRHGLARTFLHGLKDYRDANGSGSRGVYLTFVLYPGRVYEVNELQSWTRWRRFFCRVEAGKVVEMTAAEVAARLAVDAAAIQRVIDQAAGRP